MLDRWTLTLIKPPLKRLARGCDQQGIRANQVTLAGFALGMLVVPLLGFQLYTLALIAVLLNRLADGLDGELARLQGATDGGALLDIVLDFIFYAAVVAGFALANSADNALAAAFLLWGFMGTASSFLAYAILAERRKLSSMTYPSKGFYYLEGLAEGTETIAFLVAMCLFPDYFSGLAWAFFGLCVITTATRVVGGYHSLKDDSTTTHQDV
ncbi:CDP-alcohol phosphatidyltransferase family protein [Saccharospirillum alexandrii]|uniref:CDP-alcohol phosphatidyltransferase family protein n=1 Tax=Saccharospirillum alexandrii TaxID=2448477 RepID=UPI0037362980